jgi:hypothetical protein
MRSSPTENQDEDATILSSSTAELAGVDALDLEDLGDKVASISFGPWTTFRTKMGVS